MNLNNDQLIYVAGPSLTARALSHVLGVLLPSTAKWINTHEPGAIADRMIAHLSGTFSRGEESCVLDFSQNCVEVPAKVVQVLNHLRNHEDILWLGVLIAIVPDQKTAEALSETDLFGGIPGGETAFSAVSSSHRILVAPVRIGEVIAVLVEVEPLLPSTWEKAAARGDALQVVDALHAAESALLSSSGPTHGTLSRLAERARILDWAALIPMHEAGVSAEVKNARLRVCGGTCAEPETARDFLDNVRVLLGAAGIPP